jgi:hypothetical protein
MTSRSSDGRRWCSRDAEDVLGGETRVRRSNTQGRRAHLGDSVRSRHFAKKLVAGEKLKILR